MSFIFHSFGWMYRMLLCLQNILCRWRCFRSYDRRNIWRKQWSPIFVKKEVLYLINEKPEKTRLLFNRILQNRILAIIRYIGPKRFTVIFGGGFYTPNTASLKGKVIGTPGCFQKMVRMIYKCIWWGCHNFFWLYQPSGGWSGLDLGTP